MNATLPRRHLYSRATPARRPSDWWYYGRALYVSRRDYLKIYLYIFFCLGVPLVLAGWLLDSRPVLNVAFAVGGVSIVYLLYSLVGMFRMYGPPARGYLRRLLKRADVSGPVTVADLHVGTYRHSYLLADVLPEATIHSVDCWEEKGRPHEFAIADVRDLESPPAGHPRIHPTRSENHKLPFDNESLDLVTFGFGTHEIPTGGPRESLFAEARRVLKPGGKAVIFEHGNDFHNMIVFGPVIGHVTRREEWMKTMTRHFADVGYERSSYAVDLFWGTKSDVTGTVSAPLPRFSRWRASLKIMAVIAAVATTTLAAAVALTGVSLYPFLLAIAIAGITLPWAGILSMRMMDSIVK